MTDRDTLSDAGAGSITIGGDATVRRLGFGAMRLTGRGVWGEPPDRETAKVVLRRAIELGVQLIDTADSYGPEVSETLIAESLYPYPDDVVIATKAGLERSGPGQWPPNGRPAHIKAACDGSLRRLRLDQIALYQFHRPDPAVPFEDSLGAFIELQEEGKIRHIGLSNVTVNQLRRGQQLTSIVSVQNRYNLDDRHSDAVLEACEQDGLAFLAWAPIQDLDQRPALQHIATRHRADPRQIVLAWLLARSPVMVPIPGTGSVAHLKANLAAADLELSAEEAAALTSGR